MSVLVRVSAVFSDALQPIGSPRCAHYSDILRECPAISAGNLNGWTFDESDRFLQRIAKATGVKLGPASCICATLFRSGPGGSTSNGAELNPARRVCANRHPWCAPAYL